MSKLRILLAAASTATALGISALAATPASAHVMHGGHGFGHEHFGFHDSFRFRESFRFHEGWRVGGRRYGWGYGYGGPGVVVGEAAICPPGFHLGRFGRFCWPNRH
jgi:hypothetical protein